MVAFRIDDRESERLLLAASRPSIQGCSVAFYDLCAPGVRKADQERLLSPWLLPLTGVGLN